MSDMDTPDLRGSTPIYTAKEILQTLDRKVTEMDYKMDGFIMSLQIIVSQNLNERVQRLEQEGSKNAQEALELARVHDAKSKQIEGMSMMLKALFGANAIIFLAAVISILTQIGVIR